MVVPGSAGSPQPLGQTGSWWWSPITSTFLDPSTAWTHGDPRKVIYPTDSRGQFCGQKGTKNE